MKKFFTLIAATFMAVGASAQLITWTEAVTADNLAADASWTNGDFKVAITDNANKMKIDLNSQYFGTASSYTNLKGRLATGGKTGTSGGVLTNYITASAPSAGKLKIYVRTGKAADTDRTLVIEQGGSELYNAVVKETETTDYQTAEIGGNETKIFPVISVSVEEGDILLKYPVNGLTFYGIEFVANTTGLSTINTNKIDNENAPIYNLAGQRVSKDTKGILIQNGKKYVNK